MRIDLDSDDSADSSTESLNFFNPEFKIEMKFEENCFFTYNLLSYWEIHSKLVKILFWSVAFFCFFFSRVLFLFTSPGKAGIHLALA
jgi:hypothetical protein